MTQYIAYFNNPLKNIQIGEKINVSLSAFSLDGKPPLINIFETDNLSPKDVKHQASRYFHSRHINTKNLQTNLKDDESIFIRKGIMTLIIRQLNPKEIELIDNNDQDRLAFSYEHNEIIQIDETLYLEGIKSLKENGPYHYMGEDKHLKKFGKSLYDKMLNLELTSYDDVIHATNKRTKHFKSEKMVTKFQDEALRVFNFYQHYKEYL